MILILEDYSLTALSTMEYLSKCNASYIHLYNYPAYIFAFLPAAEVKCEMSLIQPNASDAIDHCIYKQVSPQPVFHKHFHGSQYFYLPVVTGVNLTLPCNKEVTQIKAERHYITPDYCDLRTKILPTFPVHQHFAFIANISTNFLYLHLLHM